MISFQFLSQHNILCVIEALPPEDDAIENGKNTCYSMYEGKKTFAASFKVHI